MGGVVGGRRLGLAGLLSVWVCQGLLIHGVINDGDTPTYLGLEILVVASLLLQTEGVASFFLIAFR